jgi:hypothetical protein
MNDILKKGFEAYIEAMILTSSNIEDDLYTPGGGSEAIEPNTLKELQKEFILFANEAYSLTSKEDRTPDIDEFGHNFWLTRAGHGAGFWDGDYINGEEITKIVDTYNTIEPYVGDDGYIYIMGKVGKKINTDAEKSFPKIYEYEDVINVQNKVTAEKIFKEKIWNISDMGKQMLTGKDEPHYIVDKKTGIPITGFVVEHNEENHIIFSTEVKDGMMDGYGFDLSKNSIRVEKWENDILKQSFSINGDISLLESLAPNAIFIRKNIEKKILSETTMIPPMKEDESCNNDCSLKV